MPKFSSLKVKLMLDLLFETSWEVCNKVGGIYAVLSTKAKTLHQQYRDNLIFIGPGLWSDANPSPSFIECRTPLAPWLRQAKLPEGMRVRVGRWDVPGKPIALLVTYEALYPFKNALYSDMWQRYRVDSLHAYGDYDESCMFAYAAALVIESIVKWKNSPDIKVVAHFDEWTTGMGLLYIKSHLPQVATVFTTHATSIGRSICGNGKPLYDYMPGYFGDQMAGELNMQSKHSLEKAAAHAADAFTTVSDVTARECRQLLERYPMVTPNAFEQHYVPKGAKLVAQRNAVAFVLVPAWVKSARADLVDNMMVDEPHRLFDPIITHNLYNVDSDPVYNRINALGFHNEAGDKVTVIDVPCYLNGNDGIFNMAYYDLLPGLDVAVFPSYYEPWGYTPLESAAFGVPTITTDLAGFGQWVLDSFGDDSDKTGIKVLHRTDSNYSDVVQAVASSLINLYMMDAKQVLAVKRGARSTSKVASWENFIKYYDEAYQHAIAKRINKKNNI